MSTNIPTKMWQNRSNPAKRSGRLPAGAAKGNSKQHGQHISEIFSSIQFPKPRCSRNRTLFGQFRVLKERLRQHYTNALTTRSPIMAWMMRHCAYLTNNYLLHSDGQTSYFRRWQRNNTAPICEFCETALYMVPTPKNQPKAEPRFFNGIWLGRDATASESFIRTAGEVVRARTILRVLPFNTEWRSSTLSSTFFARVISIFAA